MLRQGYHWMDKYGEAHWIADMSTPYLENALKYATFACRSVANTWWSFSMVLNGEMASDEAVRYAEQYDELDVPLIKGLRNELARRRGEEVLYDVWELSDWGDLRYYLQDDGYRMMDARGIWNGERDLE